MLEVWILIELGIIFTVVYGLSLMMLSKSSKQKREYRIIETIKAEIFFSVVIVTVMYFVLQILFNYPQAYGINGEIEEPDENFQLYPPDVVDHMIKTNQERLKS